MNKYQIHEKLNFTNMRELVEFAGEKYADKFAYSFRRTPKSEITKIRFSSLREDVRSLACELASMGCSGKHCAIIGKLSYDWVLTYFAVLSIGGVLVPLDPEWQKEDLADTVGKAHTSFLFCDEDIKEKSEYIAEQVKLDAEPIYLAAKDTERNLRAAMRAGKPKFDANSDPYYHADIDPDALALLVFTSGTTGKGKGVMLSQKAVLEDMTTVIPYIDFGDKTVGVLPPHHTFGSSVMIVGHTIIGSEIFISGGLRYITKELTEQKPEHLILVPLYLETFYRKIWANIKKQGKEKLIKNMIKLSNGMCKVGIDLRKKIFAQVRAAFGGEVKMIITGGAPINPEIVDFFSAMGITTLNGYGITECAPIVSVNKSRNNVQGSIGQPIDCDEIKILDPNEDGEGEICVKGPNVMLGYYQDDEATADAFTEDGFFRTGDYGKQREDGILFITGRKKNLIILSNGKNVYPEEIENALIAVPGILDIVVYEGQSKRGLAHNAIVAEIFPDEDYVKANGIEDIKAHIKPYVDEYNKTAVSYKKIGVLKIRTTPFPKNTLRKITRFKIDMTID
ncbi:MAG: AMP-binding protein [Clostridia bacterium]|nr:AMP-binding protein [Clostridia bacterium]